MKKARATRMEAHASILQDIATCTRHDSDFCKRLAVQLSASKRSLAKEIDKLVDVVEVDDADDDDEFDDDDSNGLTNECSAIFPYEEDDADGGGGGGAGGADNAVMV